MKRFCIAALGALVLGLHPASGLAQDQLTASDMGDLRTAYGLLSAGQHDAAIAAYALIRDGAGAPGLQQAAAEGEAAARVAALHAKVLEAEGARMKLRLLTFDRRSLMGVLDGDLADYPSPIMAYLRAAAAAEGPLSADLFEGHSFAAELARLDASPLPGDAQPFLALPEPVTPIVRSPDPAPATETSSSPPSAEPTVTSRSPVARDGSEYYTTDRSTLRGAPGLNGEQLAVISAGRELQVDALITLSNGQQWYALSSPVGYIAAELVQRINANAIQPGAADIQRGSISGAQTQFAPSTPAPAPAPTPEPEPEPEPAPPVVRVVPVPAPTPAPATAPVPAPAPQPAVVPSTATGCAGPAIANYRVLRVLPILSAPGGAQVTSKRVGSFVRGVTGVTEGHLVFPDIDASGEPVCRYAPMGPNAQNVMRLP